MNNYSHNVPYYLFIFQEKNADKMRLEAIKLAEQNKFPEAMNLFDSAISITPKMASLYNDRAQVL